MGKVVKNIIKTGLAILLILVAVSCGKKNQAGDMDPNNTVSYIVIPIDSSKMDYFMDIVKSINDGEEDYKYANISITEDLNLIGTGFQGIGTGTHPFEGSINGNGNKVKVDISGNTCLGFITYLRNGSVKNLTVEGQIVDGQINIGMEVSGSKHGVGGIVGYAENSRIENCVNNAKVLSEGRYVGGIVGYFKVTRNREGNSIVFCTNNSGDIKNATEETGGIAALIEGGIQTRKGTTIGSISHGFAPEVGKWKY